MEPIVLDVRSGGGTVNNDGIFNDVITVISRIPKQYSGWETVSYKGKRYHLHGGIRTNHFICLNNPIS